MSNVVLLVLFWERALPWWLECFDLTYPSRRMHSDDAVHITRPPPMNSFSGLETGSPTHCAQGA